MITLLMTKLATFNLELFTITDLLKLKMFRYNLGFIDCKIYCFLIIVSHPFLFFLFQVFIDILQLTLNWNSLKSYSVIIGNTAPLGKDLSLTTNFLKVSTKFDILYRQNDRKIWWKWRQFGFDL